MPKRVQKPRILDTLEIESKTSWAIWCWLEMVEFKCPDSAPIALGDPWEQGLVAASRGGFNSGSDPGLIQWRSASPDREKGQPR